jgi:hypothetical protein
MALVFESHLTPETLDVFARRVNEMLYMDGYYNEYLVYIDQKLAHMRDEIV